MLLENNFLILLTADYLWLKSTISGKLNYIFIVLFLFDNLKSLKINLCLSKYSYNFKW